MVQRTETDQMRNRLIPHEVDQTTINSLEVAHSPVIDKHTPKPFVYITVNLPEGILSSPFIITTELQPSKETGWSRTYTRQFDAKSREINTLISKPGVLTFQQPLDYPAIQGEMNCTVTVFSDFDLIRSKSAAKRNYYQGSFSIPQPSEE